MSRDARRGRQEPSKHNNSPPTFFQASCWPFLLLVLGPVTPVWNGPWDSVHFQKPRDERDCGAPCRPLPGRGPVGAGQRQWLEPAAASGGSVFSQRPQCGKGPGTERGPSRNRPRGFEGSGGKAGVHSALCTMCACWLSPPLSSIHCLRVLLESPVCSNAFGDAVEVSARAAFLAYLGKLITLGP